MNSGQLQAEILVVGAGPAGLAAACEASEAGKSVVVLDNSPWLGGQIWRGEQAHSTQAEAREWFQHFRKSGARIIPSATAFAAPAPSCLLAETPSGVIQVLWQKLIIATGARELFLPFPGWTLPGVVAPAGLHVMSRAAWPVVEKRIVLAGSGPLLLAAADGLRRHGAEVLLVAEQAPFSKVLRFGLGLWRCPDKLSQSIEIMTRLHGVPYRCGCWPVRAEGDDRVRQVTLSNGRKTWTLDCDYLACGFHLVPNVELPMLLGCELVNGFVRVGEFQETSVSNVFCAGEPTGVGGADCALVEGRIAGLAAVGSTEQASELLAARASWHRFRDAINSAFALRPELRALPSPQTVVCRCEDVPHRALVAFDDWRAAKLHSRCGMGACQGRTCGPAAQFLFGWTNDSVRPPVFPVPVAALLTPGQSQNKLTEPLSKG